MSISRHWQVAKEAYKREKAQALSKLPVHQEDFLPAALEIMESPPSPAGRVTFWLITLFFVIAILWAFIGKIDVVATAQGKVAPHGQSKVIQSIETGAVSDILIENGSRVKKGDVLIELDATYVTADVEQLKRQLQSSHITEARNRWLLSLVLQVGKNHASSENIGSELLFPVDTPNEVKLVQKLLAEKQYSEFVAVQAAFAKQLEEKRTEQRVVKESLAKLQDTLPLLQEQVTGVTELEKKGIVPRFQYLEYEERLMSRIKDIAIEQERIKQVHAGMESIEQQSFQHFEQFQKNLVVELAEATDNIVAIEQELTKAQKTQTMQSLRSPIDGVVQQLTMNTKGGVVAAGEPIMVIVPEGAKLQVEASILNKDIGFVSVGQAVEIKLDAFPFTKYGVAHGEILSIDSDAVQDENLGLVYPVRISLNEKTISVNNNPVPISAGMSLVAEVKIKQRRIIEFLLSPLLRYKDESLRER